MLNFVIRSTSTVVQLGSIQIYRSRTFRRRCFGDAVSATPILRRDVLATAVSAAGRFGDRRFGDGTFRRPPVRRWEVSATGRFGDGRFGDQSSTVFFCQIIYGAQIKTSEDETFCFISNIRPKKDDLAGR